ncbi:MAG TPA: hypothetical protein VK968_06505, partial [Roseimicrobium sp.]|nr:hypothetical protein [Roseimicrobium sp.]
MSLRAFLLSLAYLSMNGGNFQQSDLNATEYPVPLQWKRLASLPDKEAFAAMFAGVSNGRLIAAGGANFPDKRPWEGGTKVWYDTVYVMDTPSSEWKTAGKLPDPTAYGVSVTTADGVVCIGGSDSKQHKRDVFLMSIKDRTLDFKPLPPLPKPCANMCGARATDFIYIAGGSETPDATNALHTFWALNLNAIKKGWLKLEPWPGPARILATAGALDGSFYLIGGAGLKPGADGKPVREWYKDVYRYTPGKGWER